MTSLAARNPGIVMVSGSVFGQTGPLAQEWGVDGTGGALSGRTFLTGYPDRDPVIPGAVPYGDVIVPYRDGGAASARRCSIAGKPGGAATSMRRCTRSASSRCATSLRRPSAASGRSAAAMPIPTCCSGCLSRRRRGSLGRDQPVRRSTTGRSCRRLPARTLRHGRAAREDHAHRRAAAGRPASPPGWCRIART